MNNDRKVDIDDVPEDVLEELREALKELEDEIPRGSKKRKYPSSRDITDAVIEASYMATGIDPDEFPDMVRRILEEKGFYTGLVNDKRIWRVYETLVRRRVIRDVLGVVSW